MTYLLFITITGIIGAIGAVLFSRHSNWNFGKFILLGLSLLFLTSGFTEYLASFDENLVTKIFCVKFSMVAQCFIALLLLELSTSFLGKEGIETPFILRKKHIRLQYLWRPLFLFIIIFFITTPWFILEENSSRININLSKSGELLLSALFCYHLLNIYVIEKLFRTITVVQKRYFVQFLGSSFLISLGSMILFVNFLFYKNISFETLQIHAALCNIFFPGFLIGLARYRLWEEQLQIGRGIVYTSFTILFFGIFLIFLGFIAAAVRFFDIDFNQFDEFVIAFSLLFIGILVFFSPHMRKTITLLTKKYIYKSKYDYRDQLLRLHTAHQTSGDISQTIKAFIDNLQYTIVVKNAYVFIRSVNENNFSLFTDPGMKIKKHTSFRANSPLITLFEKESLPAINVHQQNAGNILSALESEYEILAEYSISHFFAIKFREKLLALLCINCGTHVFDSEDLMLISLFCESVGTAVYRDRLNLERIEQKQFESFAHMSSFIVHDIKNQIATLTLVTNNAKSNISNPEFHPTLLRSLQNCSRNLSTLMDKLKSPPQIAHIHTEKIDCSLVLTNVLEETKPSLPPGIIIRENITAVYHMAIDETALYFVIKNLLVNAIEALGNSGVISCAIGMLASFIHDDTFHFCLTSTDRQNNQLYILIEDNGPGMSRDYVNNRLFRPFTTTKDKGIGLGLYQCKTLVESMNGRLLCWSEKEKGTRFCILL